LLNEQENDDKKMDAWEGVACPIPAAWAQDKAVLQQVTPDKFGRGGL